MWFNCCVRVLPSHSCKGGYPQCVEAYRLLHRSYFVRFGGCVLRLKLYPHLRQQYQVSRRRVLAWEQGPTPPEWILSVTHQVRLNCGSQPHGRSKAQVPVETRRSMCSRSLRIWENHLVPMVSTPTAALVYLASRLRMVAFTALFVYEDGSVALVCPNYCCATLCQ